MLALAACLLLLPVIAADARGDLGRDVWAWRAAPQPVTHDMGVAR